MDTSRLIPMIGRQELLFQDDLRKHGHELDSVVSESRFLVIGGAGSIGSAVVRELFARNPPVLHVVDISENNLAELVRGIRSSQGYIDGDFSTYCFDVLGAEFDAFMNAQVDSIGGYDYVLNFSALKHVRSEKDPFTLMRLIDVNIYATRRTLAWAQRAGATKFFCVSTDKAANPVNMMGGSKRIMEMFLARDSGQVPVSMARFANVAFSDGSLPHSWRQRLDKRQPLAAPSDVRRYFVTDSEGAILCLFSMLLGQDGQIFFPKLSEHLHLITFSDMCVRFLDSMGIEAVPCESEEEARSRVEELASQRKWPCYFFSSNTTGEKDFEEFFTDHEAVDWDRFAEMGVVMNAQSQAPDCLKRFDEAIAAFRSSEWTRSDLVALFRDVIPDFGHKETGRFLDGRM